MSRNVDCLRQLFTDLDRLDFACRRRPLRGRLQLRGRAVRGSHRVGPEAIRAKLAYGLGTLERLPTTIHEIAEAGDTVLVERTEVWHHRSGERATLRVAAVFKFRDGKLVLWRDYWDARTLLSQQPADWLPEIPRV